MFDVIIFSFSFFVWGKHENMSPRTDRRVNQQRIASCNGTQFQTWAPESPIVFNIYRWMPHYLVKFGTDKSLVPSSIAWNNIDQVFRINSFQNTMYILPKFVIIDHSFQTIYLNSIAQLRAQFDVI